MKKIATVKKGTPVKITNGCWAGAKGELISKERRTPYYDFLVTVKLADGTKRHIPNGYVQLANAKKSTYARDY